MAIYNPSGYHAPVAVQTTMGHYGLDLREKVSSDDPDYFDISPTGKWRFTRKDDDSSEVQTLTFDRVAMNLEHIRRFDLPENPTPSSTDKDRKLRDNFMNYVSDGRDTNVELNALREFHPDVFEEMIEDKIKKYISVERREAVNERVEDRRQYLSDAISIDRSQLPDDL